MAMDPRDWMTLTQYPQTSLSNYAVNQVMEPQGTRVTTSSAPGLQDAAIIAWDRGVKRSKDEYPVLKNEKDWDKFHRKLKLQAIYEGIGNQLNPDWKPSSSAKEVLDQKHRQCFFNVLEHILLTDHGKTILQDHMAAVTNGIYSGRHVYAKL